MADSTVPLNTGSGGKTLDTESLTGAGSVTVERQRVEVGGSALAEIARVINSAPGGSEYSLVTRNIPSGTQAISASSLPLPTGAAQDATLTGGTARTKVTDGTNNAAVKAASTAAAATDPALVVAVSPNNSVAVTGTFWQSTQPVSGTVTANQGTAAALASGWPVKHTDGVNTMPAMDAAARKGFLAVTDGTNTAVVKAGSGAAAFADAAMVVDVRPGGIHPAAAALADATANPTESRLAADNHLYNNTSWDRQRGNWNVATGDSGTKSATFSGAAQTNYNARGALITVLLGTVSGTSPTLACQVQWSPDGGTTWLTFGPALANLTATNQTGTIIVYPTGLQQSLQNGGTAAGLATGSNVTLGINAPLARTWRIQFTIGGTSPSFAISSVQVQYVL